MVEGLAELSAACRPSGPGSHSTIIAEGGEHWFMGHPVPSDPRTIALAQTPEIKLVFREEDIRAVHKHGERYVVRVATDANMLVRHEQMMKAAQSRCECGSGEEGGKTGSIARQNNGRIDPDANVNYIEDAVLVAFQLLHHRHPVRRPDTHLHSDRLLVFLTKRGRTDAR